MYNLAVVGATGMVGKMILQVLKERRVELASLRLFASPQEAGTKILVDGMGEITIETLTETTFNRENGAGIDYALFAVDNEFSRRFAPIAAANGCVVIDNSSAWRLDPAVPLIVPEVNRADLAAHKGIIANPNCCACPTVVALKPLHDAYGLKRVVISTYQSVSGAGVGGWRDLDETLKGNAPAHFPHPIAFNLIPHIDTFDEHGYTGEETKLMAEVRKMLHLPELKITATTVRVPVYSGHSLSINAEFEHSFDIDAARQKLKVFPSVRLTDDPSNALYPMPIDVAGTDEVHIGRVRRDFSSKNALNLWVVADNIRKGAATNAVQILEEMGK
jgi:aspartate-semialdehyde dehydrogenase